MDNTVPMTPNDSRLREQWNATQADYSRDACLHHLFERQAELTPDAAAIELLGEVLSYRELNRRADRLADRLRSFGVKRDSRVAMCTGRSFDLAIGLLAILKSGGACVPLDPRYPADRLSFMLDDAKAEILITQTELLRELPESAIHTLCLDSLDWTAWPGGDAVLIENAPIPDSLVYVIYTSGSTGRPKGVAMVHRALVNLVEWQNRQSTGLPSSARTLQFTSLSFDVSFQEIFATWSSGGTLVLMPEEWRYDPVKLWRCLSDQHIHRLYLPFIALQQIAEAAAQSNELPVELCQVITAGEQLQITPGIKAMFRRLKRAELYNQYGPAETHVATAYALPKDVDSWVPLPPIGKPVANTQIYLVNEGLQQVPIGEPGELLIGGDCLSRGYLDRHELTLERYLVDPFSGKSGARLYRTGDLARHLPDGNIQFLGRIDNQVKIRGHRVELGEIESVLSQHAAVRECAVTVRGTGNDSQLVAYVTVVNEQGLSHEDLRAFLKSRLADYMVPVHYVTMAKLPLTPSGKVDRRALPKPHHTHHEDAPTGDSTTPATGLESLIAEIWKEILRLPFVNAEVSFFDLGGNSLMLVRVQQQLQEMLRQDVSILTLFQYPTIAGLAKYLSAEGRRLAAAITLPELREPRGRSVFKGTFGSSNQYEGIAIVGMAGRFPGARTVEEFWRNLCEGRESLSTFTDDELLSTGVDPDLLKDPAYVRTRGVLDDVDRFDAAFFGFTPRDAEVTDPQHRLFLECAWHAMEDGGCDPAEFSGAIGVYAGSSLNTYFLTNVLSERATLEQFTRGFQVDGYNLLVGNDKDYLASRVAYKLNLRGPAVTVQTACSTSLVAVSQACAGLLSGQCDLALAGGVSISFPQHRGYVYQEGAIASEDGHCRAFDAKASGTAFGAGVAVVLLKRYADALSDGDHIYAVIKAAAINNDGSDKMSFSAPSMKGQSDVIRQAHKQAGISAETIGYVEAHGTGTPLGDPIEIAALTRAFRVTTDKKQFCALGSVKANVGHLESAAGVTGLIKAALILQHKVIPPTPHFQTPNPKCEFESSPFFVARELTQWKQKGGAPRRAAVSSFGIGGTNAHVVLEEAPEIKIQNDSRMAHLLILSAKSEDALNRSAENLAAHFASNPKLSLADAAFTLQTGRRGLPFRRVVVASDTAEAGNKLKSSEPKSVFSGQSRPSEPGVVFMFPGQGSQYVNMGRELYSSQPVFRQEMDHCAGLLTPMLGFDIRTLLYPPPEELESAGQRLGQTHLAQPALFVLEYALAALWMSWGIKPAALVGHSVGEYAAAVLAEVISLEDALSLITDRGGLMQSVPSGGMLSVRLSESEIHPLLNKALSVAVVNSVKSCVVAGPNDEIAELHRSLTKRGILCKPLHTSHAFHSPMMEPVLEHFTRRLQDVVLNEARLPIVSSQTGRWIKPGDWIDPGYWARQIREPVRFADAVTTLTNHPQFVLLEVGPGQTLAPLAMQHPLRRKEQFALSSMPAIENTDETGSLLSALGRLWIAGVNVNWNRFHEPEQRRRMPLPGYPFDRQRHWLERPKAAQRAPVFDEKTFVPADPVEEVIRLQLATMRMQLKALDKQRED